MTDIVTIPTGAFTPGALATLSYPANLINAAWSQANDKFATFESKMALVTNIAGTGWLDTAATPTITAGTASATTPTDPNVTVPTTISADTIFASFDTKQLAMWDQLVDGFADFRSTYFPEETTAYAAAENWLQEAIASASGLPAAVTAQMLTDDKDRINAEVSRASDSLMAKFASSRFPMPPGALASAVLQLQQTAQDEVAASSRKITIASIEQLKFAVEKLVGMRQMAMSAALDYVKTLAGTSPVATQLVGAGYEAQTRLIGAAAGYLNARTAVADLATKNAQFNVANALQAAEKNQMATLTVMEDKLKAMVGELSALAQMATSLFNNLHVSTGTQYSTSVSEST